MQFQDTLNKLSRSIQTLQHDGVKGTAGWGNTRAPWADKVVQWEDLEDVLPTTSDGAQLLDVFFGEMQWLINYIARDRLETSWKTLTSKGGHISHFAASLVCSIFATVYLLCPRASAAHKVIEKEPLRGLVLLRTARKLLHEGSLEDEDDFGDSVDIIDDELEVTFEQLQAYTMYASYCSLAGLTKKTWISLGEAIRLGKASDLFDESRWSRSRSSGRDRDEVEIEYRRRMAWALAMLDRWQGLHYYRAIDLADEFSVQPPSLFVGDLNDPMVRFGRLLMNQGTVIRDVYRFIRNLTRMSAYERRQQALLIDSSIETWYSDLPDWLTYENACCNVKADDPQSYKLAAQALLLHNSMYKLRCILMRPFLLDSAAPHAMRFGALRSARKILEAMPLLVTLSNNPWTIIPPSWPMHQVFVAASTFTIVLLSSPGEGTGGSKLSTEGSNWQNWAVEDLDWFASNVHEAIDTLHLVGSGMTGATARVSKRLLEGLISQREKLKERFERRNELSDRAAQGRTQKDNNISSVMDIRTLSWPSASASPAYGDAKSSTSAATSDAPSMRTPQWLPTTTPEAAAAAKASLETPDTTPPGSDAFADWPFMAPWEWATLTDIFDNGQLDFAV